MGSTSFIFLKNFVSKKCRKIMGSTDEFKIKFDGNKHQIDANTLINNLIHLSHIIQEINKGIDVDKKIGIEIKAIEKGSFLIHIELVESFSEGFKNLFTKDNLNTTSTIITSLVGLLQLVIFLKGEKADKKEKLDKTTVIKNYDGNTIIADNIVVNIYENNPIVKEALSKSFETLESDPNITGYEIIGKQDEILARVNRNEFRYMTNNYEEMIDGERKHVIITNLNIIRISFDKKLRSDFYYRGDKISAKITDNDFYENIEKGKSFSKGDILEVELEVKQKLDKSVNVFVNKGYKILRIINHIKRDNQSKLDLNI